MQEMIRRSSLNASFGIRTGTLAIFDLPCIHVTSYRWISSSIRVNQMEGDPGSATTTVDAMWQGKKFPKSHHLVSPGVIFPWRHDTDLIPRLVVGSEEYAQQGGHLGPSMPLVSAPMRYLNTCAAAYLIQAAPWYSIPFHGWKEDFADTTSWAFTQAVAAMMSNMYQVPFEQIRQENVEFQLDFNHTTTEPSSNDPVDSQESHEESSDTSELDSIIEEKLRKLYEFAHASGRAQMQIRLKMQPTSAKLLGFFMLPFSRDLVKKYPSLAVPLDKTRETMTSRVESAVDVKTGSIPFTVVAQVLVYCDEIFCVEDLKCGTILQGHKDGQVRNVSHVVRLETVGEYNVVAKTTAVAKPWHITDWDDLLEGNLWIKHPSLK